MGYRKEVQVPHAVGPSELQAEATLWPVPKEPVGPDQVCMGIAPVTAWGCLPPSFQRLQRALACRAPVSSCV